MRVVWAGTFDPEFSRNRKLGRLLYLRGCETRVIREPLWPPDRIGIAAGGWWRLLMKSLWLYPKLLARLFLERRPDLYLVSYPGWFDMPSIWIVSKLKRRPIVFDPFISLHDTVVSDRALRSEGSLTAKVARLADRWSLRLADVVLADTLPDLDLFEAVSPGTAGKGRVLPVGADDTVFRPRPGAEPDPGRVLFYGSFVPLQGVTTIVEAAALLAGEGIRFAIIGDGQERPLLEEVMGRTGVDIDLEGFIPLDELPAHITRAQVCLGIFGNSDKASRVVPHKLYECLAMGRPVITRDGAGIRSLFGDHEVVLVPPADAGALAAAIRTLVADPMQRARVQEAGHSAYLTRFHETRLAGLLVGALDTAVQ